MQTPQNKALEPSKQAPRLAKLYITRAILGLMEAHDPPPIRDEWRGSEGEEQKGERTKAGTPRSNHAAAKALGRRSEGQQGQGRRAAVADSVSEM